MILLAGLPAACGDDEPRTAGTTTTTEPAATATATPAETATATPTPTVGASPTPTIPPAEEGGDEAGNRVELHFDLHAEDVQPPAIEVPAFLGLRVTVRNQSGAERVVRLKGEPVLELLPGETQTAEVEGLRPGDHLLEAGESGRATITAERAG